MASASVFQRPSSGNGTCKKYGPPVGCASAFAACCVSTDSSADAAAGTAVPASRAAWRSFSSAPFRSVVAAAAAAFGSGESASARRASFASKWSPPSSTSAWSCLASGGFPSDGRNDCTTS